VSTETLATHGDSDFSAVMEHMGQVSTKKASGQSAGI
jgi:hypothetical protein